jgi:hypothetical protein
MESRSDRAGRDAEGVGDLGKRQTHVVMEHEYRPVFDGQPLEGSVERVAIDNGDQPIGSRRSVDGKDPDVGRPCPTAPGLGVAGVNEQATNPGLEAIRVAQCRELPPDSDERALEGVFSKIAIAQDPRGQRVQSVAGRVDQRRESFAITASCAFDEISHRLSSLTPSDDVVTPTEWLARAERSSRRESFEDAQATPTGTFE